MEQQQWWVGGGVEGSAAAAAAVAGRLLHAAALSQGCRQGMVVGGPAGGWLTVHVPASCLLGGWPCFLPPWFGMVGHWQTSQVLGSGAC